MPLIVPRRNIAYPLMVPFRIKSSSKSFTSE
jgi:hypothetical protein